MRSDLKRAPLHPARAVQSHPTLEQIQLQLNQLIQKVEAQNNEIKANKLRDETKNKEVVRTNFRETNMPGIGTAEETIQGPNQTRYKSNLRCYNCNRYGHVSRECRAPRRPRVSEIQYNENENSVMNSNPINNSNESHRVGVIFDTVDPAQEVYIQMKIGDENICCLLDSGCQISILPHSLVRGEVMYASSKRMKAANDIEIPVLGEIEINLELGPLILPTRFLVSDHVTEVMLGFDFLKSNKIQWNFDSDELSIQGIDFKLCTAVNSGWHRRVVLETDVRIPSNCEMDVPASVLVRRLSVAEAWMTEATEIKSGICSARSLVSNKGMEAVVRLINISDTPTTLKAGMVVSDLKEVQLTNATGTFSDSDSHLTEMLSRVDGTVPPEIRVKLESLVRQYSTIFSRNEFDLGKAVGVQHHINTGSAKPFRQTLRRHPDRYLPIIDEQVEVMLKQGIVEPSKGPYASNIVLVTKKDGTIRACLDLRQLNQQVRESNNVDTYPLPLISSCLDSVSGSNWFSTFDLRSGYHQIELNPADAPKTTFLTRKGAFQYKVLPFGCCNGPATCQRLMDFAMAGLNFSICLIYLDDIIVHSNTLEEHLERLLLIFQRLKDVNLKLKPSKCHLLQQTVVFLGHLITPNGITADPSKISAVAEWPVPTCVKEVRSFCSFASYYRRFVPSLADIAKPLYELTKKHARYEWTDSHQHAFETLKSHLTQPPVLAMPQDEGEFTLDTDCSDVAASAVLSQMINGEERVIAYASKTLSKSEQLYCITRRELLAVVNFVKHFRCYLVGRTFRIRTDHAALMYLHKSVNLLGQSARWLQYLEEFNYRVEHRRSAQHANADGLTRMKCKQCGMEDEPVAHLNRAMRRSVSSQSSNYQMDEYDEYWTQENIVKMTEEDTELKAIIELLKHHDEQPSRDEILSLDEITKCYWTQWPRLLFKNGVLYRRFESDDGKTHFYQWIPPVVCREKLIDYVHSGMTGGHYGVLKTQHQVQRRAYWFTWKSDVLRYCDRCTQCVTYHRGGAPKRGFLQPFITGAPMEIISIDICGPFPKSEKSNRFIITVVDHFSKYAAAYCVPNHTAEIVACKLMQGWISTMGTPYEILTDQGTEFESKLFQELCRVMNIDKIRTSVYRPSTNAIVERFHRSLNSILAKIMNDHQGTWDDYVPFAISAYNNSKHASTNESPNKLIFGRELTNPIDLVLGQVIEMR